MRAQRGKVAPVLSGQGRRGGAHVVGESGELVQRRWVTRRPDEHDRRSTIATLTEAGWDKVVAAAPGHIAEVRRLLIDGRTPEQLAVLRDVGVSVARQSLGDRCADSLLPEDPWTARPAGGPDGSG
ncbi:hypothetical protein LRP67_03210 [Nocardioides sp. cx-169]|uniref:MarR family winged helix-turn-helix transcriptional regulator n=1 Tax=Nocardioides sp. cx-169 TaxID=2899080 RepID=UPI001E453DCD|nr:hypothetical protein [Nocardioides sp. cx-169]MCD4533088.1 hypothetical protein [Nocardioides sp. cx-169]